MKRDKIIYWVATVIVAFMMTFSGINYFINPEMKAGFTHMGFPDYFRIELGIAKILGAIVLLLPNISPRFKEWAYFGFGLTFISASIAHFSSGDGPSGVIPPLVFLVILSVSYLYYHRLQSTSNQVLVARS